MQINDQKVSQGAIVRNMRYWQRLEKKTNASCPSVTSRAKTCRGMKFVMFGIKNSNCRVIPDCIRNLMNVKPLNNVGSLQSTRSGSTQLKALEGEAQTNQVTNCGKRFLKWSTARSARKDFSIGSTQIHNLYSVASHKHTFSTMHIDGSRAGTITSE